MRRTTVSLSAGALVLAVVATGCGGSGKPAATKSSSGSASASASASPAAAGSLGAKVSAVRDRVEKAGTGSFTLSDATIAGKALSTIDGRYSLDDETLDAAVSIPDGTGKSATAKIRVLGDTAYIQAAEWKPPSNTCWLKTTPAGISSDYGLDVSSADVPLPLLLLGKFQPQTSSGEGVYQGELDLASATLLLSGTTKSQVEQAKPKGTVPAFVTDDGTTATVTVPGYAMATALSTALKVDDSQFTAMKSERYEATLGPAKDTSAIAAPEAGKQMSKDDLTANRCG
ncbi:MAG: hypothetical protein JWO46_2984 [Nocardioidaceae bacterium]|nr:hypothetical protein [Nocardioidaceae bacterium]